jgi:hypothetical protein
MIAASEMSFNARSPFDGAESPRIKAQDVVCSYPRHCRLLTQKLRCLVEQEKCRAEAIVRTQAHA